MINLLTALACSVICLRLLTYTPRPGAAHRRHAAWLAWILIVFTGGQALHIVLVGPHANASPWNLGVLLVLAVLSCRARGNVANMMKPD